MREKERDRGRENTQSETKRQRERKSGGEREEEEGGREGGREKERERGFFLAFEKQCVFITACHTYVTEHVCSLFDEKERQGFSSDLLAFL